MFLFKGRKHSLFDLILCSCLCGYVVVCLCSSVHIQGVFSEGGGVEGGLKERGRNEFLLLKRGGLLEGEGLFERVA